VFSAVFIDVQTLAGAYYPYPLIIPSSTVFQVRVRVSNAVAGVGNVTLTWTTGVDTVGPSSGPVSGRGTGINAPITDGQALALIGTTTEGYVVYQIDGMTPGQEATGRQRNRGAA